MADPGEPTVVHLVGSLEPSYHGPKGRNATSWDSLGTALLTHAGATHEHDEEGLQNASHAYNPGQAQEEDHTKNVLQAGQVDADEGAHAWALRETEQQL